MKHWYSLYFNLHVYYKSLFNQSLYEGSEKTWAQNFTADISLHGNIDKPTVGGMYIWASPHQ